MKTMIIPAVIAKTQEELTASINKVHQAVSLIQLDVMDGEFVPNTSIDFDFHLPKTSCQFEAHLMVQHPEEWITKHAKKVQCVLAHIEACDDPEKIISMVKKQKKKMGFVLNPGTPLSSIEPYLDEIQQVLFMTVNPGFYGSKFLPEVLPKIAQLRQQRPTLDIEVDGGVTDETIRSVAQTGTNMFVSGSFIMKAPDVKQAIKQLENKIKV